MQEALRRKDVIALWQNVFDLNRANGYDHAPRRTQAQNCIVALRVVVPLPIHTPFAGTHHTPCDFSWMKKR